MPPPADGSFSPRQATEANEKLASFFTKRTILGLRYDADVSKRVIELLKGLEIELVKATLEAAISTPKTTNGRKARAEAMLAEVRKEIARQFKRINKLTQGELFDLADIEVKATRRGLINTAADLGVRLGVGLPSDAVFAALFDDVAVMSVPLTDWWAQQEARFFNEFSQAVRVGVTAGETTDEIARRIAGDRWGDLRGVSDDAVSDQFRKARRGARALVRTSVASVQGTARQAVYEANTDVIVEIVHVSRLDSHTSDICLARAGKRWDAITKEPIGHKLPFQVPPLHVNCRSVHAPVVIGGGSIAKHLGADEWISSLPRHEQDDLLGKGKADLYRAGKIKASELIDQSNRPLTLEELAQH